MKATRLVPLLCFALCALPARGFILKSAIYVDLATPNDPQDFVANDGSEARTDQTIDSSTVRLTLGVNWTFRRWELRCLMAQTGSEDLTGGADVTLGKKLRVNLFTYPLGDSQYGRGYYILGKNLTSFDYSPTANEVTVEFEPVAPVDSQSVTGANWTAAAGMDIYFRGTYQDPGEINYGPPVVVGNVLSDDVDRAAHPSSGLIMGKALRFSGMDGAMGDFEFTLGSRHAAAKGYDLENSQGYVDGTQPATGFSQSHAATSFPMTLGYPSETFMTYRISNSHWSARDIQVGQFPQPLKFTAIHREAGGVRLTWSAEATKTYTLQYFDALNGSSSALATGLAGPDYLDTAAGEAARFYRLVEE